MMDSPGWSWTLKVGQFRQPFGIEQQTGSSSIAFPERAIMDGGAAPMGAVKLVTERVMGLHIIQAKDFGPFGYKAQFTLANDKATTRTTLRTPARWNHQGLSQQPGL